ncbi:hypothetical protein GCM10023079_21440 [Streptomyces chitinivorans]
MTVTLSRSYPVSKNIGHDYPAAAFRNMPAPPVTGPVSARFPGAAPEAVRTPPPPSVRSGSVSRAAGHADRR